MSHFLKQVALHYPNATKIRLVQDNLNTHNPSSLTIKPLKSAAFELTPTPPNRGVVGARLNCLCFQNSVFDLIGELSELDQQVTAWAEARILSVNWQFTLNQHSTDFIHNTST